MVVLHFFDLIPLYDIYSLWSNTFKTRKTTILIKIRFQGYSCESVMAWKATWNYAYGPQSVHIIRLCYVLWIEYSSMLWNVPYFPWILKIFQIVPRDFRASTIHQISGKWGGGGGEDYTSNPDKICQIQLNERMMNVSKWEQRNKKINENEIRSAGWWLVAGGWDWGELKYYSLSYT